MKADTLKGNIETAYGNPVNPALKYQGTIDLYETPEEVKTANDWPSNDEIVSMVNQKRKAAKRAEFMKAALDAAGITAPTLEDKSVQFAQMVKIFKATGQDEATARVSAEAALGHSGN